jgi:hypothetical protein
MCKSTSLYINNLFQIANLLRRKASYPATTSLAEAATMVITYLTTSVLTQADHYPVKGHLKEKEAIAGTIFLCFIASPIIINGENEGFELPLNDIVADAGFAVFQMLPKKEIAETISDGIEQYKRIITHSKDHPDIINFIDSMNELVYQFIVSQDNQYLPLFSKMYKNLCDSIDT